MTSLCVLDRLYVDHWFMCPGQTGCRSLDVGHWFMCPGQTGCKVSYVTLQCSVVQCAWQSSLEMTDGEGVSPDCTTNTFQTSAGIILLQPLLLLP